MPFPFPTFDGNFSYGHGSHLALPLPSGVSTLLGITKLPLFFCFLGVPFHQQDFLSLQVMDVYHFTEKLGKLGFIAKFDLFLVFTHSILSMTVVFCLKNLIFRMIQKFFRLLVLIRIDSYASLSLSLLLLLLQKKFR